MVGTATTTEVLHWQRFAFAWSGINLPLFTTDLIYFIGLCALAILHARNWLVWSAGLQLACVLTHFGPLIDPATKASVYRGLETIWMPPMMITMVAGIAKDRSRSVA